MARRSCYGCFGDYGPLNATVARNPETGGCPPGMVPISDTMCGPMKGSVVDPYPAVEAVRADAHEPILRLPNIVNAGAAAAAFALGWKKWAAVLLVLNGLDIVGRQVSPDYRELTRLSKTPVAGLGFIPAVRRIDWR